MFHRFAFFFLKKKFAKIHLIQESAAQTYDVIFITLRIKLQTLLFYFRLSVSIKQINIKKSSYQWQCTFQFQ